MNRSCSGLLEPGPSAIFFATQRLTGEADRLLYSVVLGIGTQGCSARPVLRAEMPEKQKGWRECAQRAWIRACGRGLKRWLSSKQWRRFQGSPYNALSHCGQGPRLGVVRDLAPLFAPSYIHARRLTRNSHLNSNSLSRHVGSSACFRDGKSCQQRQSDGIFAQRRQASR